MPASRLARREAPLLPCDGMSSVDPTCEICGRTILKGERTRRYVSPDGEQREVCDLCRTRVEGARWVRAGRSDVRAPSPDEPAGNRARAWLSERAARARLALEETRLRAAEGAGAKAERTGPRVQSGPDTPERRLRRALEEFNESEHRRTVAGLTRSLGEPRVAAVATIDAPHDIRLTVAWDLSWYQWEVRLADEPARVRSVAKGSELEQLAESDRHWNARAGDDGRLQLAAGRNGAW
jgi:ribosome-binding protein aMBF1 (putative translation factor)